jgi:hypothetical protein
MSSAAAIRQTVADVVAATQVYDIHTHLYDPAFGELLLWGIDDLLIYHYLVAEAFRYSDAPYEEFFPLAKVTAGRVGLEASIRRSLADLRSLPGRAHHHAAARL